MSNHLPPNFFTQASRANCCLAFLLWHFSFTLFNCCWRIFSLEDNYDPPTQNNFTFYNLGAPKTFEEIMIHNWTSTYYCTVHTITVRTVVQWFKRGTTIWWIQFSISSSYSTSFIPSSKTAFSSMTHFFFCTAHKRHLSKVVWIDCVFANH